MSRTIHVTLNEQDVIAKCQAAKVGVSAIERLPMGGVRLVCMSAAGAEVMRSKFKSSLVKGEVTRERHRPTRPVW